MVMASAFLAPFIKGFFSSPRNTMEASGSSVCMAENSHNRTVNVYNYYDTSSKDKTVSPESTQIEEVTPNAIHIDTKPMQEKMLSRWTGTDMMGSIIEEEESTPSTFSNSTTSGNAPPDRTTTPNPLRTIRVVDAKELMNESTKRRYPVWNDSVSGRSAGSAKTSQCSTVDGKGCIYPLSKLKPEKLRFSEPVEKHVKTYMTSKKQNFEKGRNVICLWHPFSNMDLDNHIQEKHCVLGDVGRFNSSGGFDVLFNIFMTMEENHEMHYFPPNTFKPFVPPIRDHHSREPTEESRFFLTCDLKHYDEEQTRQVVFFAPGHYSFRSKESSADGPGSAVLVAPNGCSVKQIEKHLLSFLRTYLTEQVDSWYDPSSYPNEQHENLSSGSLNLICTCYKSKVWAAAAMPRSFMKKKAYINAKLLRSPDDPDVYKWDVHPLFKVTHGSSKPDVSKIEYTVAVEVYPLPGLPASGALDRLRSSVWNLNKLPFFSAFTLH